MRRGGGREVVYSKPEEEEVVVVEKPAGGKGDAEKEAYGCVVGGKPGGDNPGGADRTVERVIVWSFQSACRCWFCCVGTIGAKREEDEVSDDAFGGCWPATDAMRGGEMTAAALLVLLGFHSDTPFSHDRKETVKGETAGGKERLGPGAEMLRGGGDRLLGAAE